MLYAPVCDRHSRCTVHTTHSLLQPARLFVPGFNKSERSVTSYRSCKSQTILSVYHVLDPI